MIFTEKNEDQLEKLLQPVLERKILELVISKASCEEQALSLEEMDALLEKMGEEFKNIPKISMSNILIPMVVEQTSIGGREPMIFLLVY